MCKNNTPKAAIPRDSTRTFSGTKAFSNCCSVSVFLRTDNLNRPRTPPRTLQEQKQPHKGTWLFGQMHSCNYMGYDEDDDPDTNKNE